MTRPPALLFHGTRTDFETLDLTATVDGGLHFGSEAQARMRAGRSGRLLAVELDVFSVRRSRDTGGQWKAKIRQAKASGCNALVYLNRYEGIPPERFEALAAQGVDPDRLSDAQFRRAVPEAQDSWIVFDLAFVRRLPAHDLGPVTPRSRLTP